MTGERSPYCSSEEPGPATQVFGGLWREFLSACDKHPRGIFARLSDTGTQSRLILAAVATVLAPVIMEVVSLRREVAELRAERSDR